MANVADHYLARLAECGVDTAFLVYGGAMAELADAFTRQNRIRYVCTQHEQAAIFAAEGYAKAKADGTPGLVIVTSGPGGGNIVTGLMNCMYDSTPLIALCGQVSSAFGNPPGSPLRQLGFQEAPMVAVARPITKHTCKPDGPLHAAYCLEAAIMEATTGRPGPVLIDLPIDVQRMAAPEPRPTLQARVDPYPDCAHAAGAFLQDLGASARPGILVGGGAYRSRAAILAFAAAHNVPIFRTWNALDVVTDDHPCFGGTVGTYGGAGRNLGVQNTDLLLALGCRLSGRITGGMPETFARGAKLYVVDVDPGLLDPKYQPRRADVNVHADCGEFIKEIS